MRPIVVESVQVSPLSVPTTDPFRIASGVAVATRSVLVEVTVASGGESRPGLGEGSCLPPVTTEDQPDAQAHVEAVAPALLGTRFDRLEDFEVWLRAHLGHAPVAATGLETAVLDAWARLEGTSVRQLLAVSHTPCADQIETDVTIPILAPELMAQRASEWAARGFRALKIKVGKSFDDDLRALELMARAAPGCRFRPDANAGFSVAEAVRFIEAARRVGAPIECFEQPCATLEELHEVASKIEPCVVADESVKSLTQLEDALRRGLIEGVNLKLAKSGGLLGALAIGRAARGRGLQVMVGGMLETRLGMTAACHLASTLGGVEFADLDTAFLLTRDEFVGGYADDGPHYRLARQPGWGVSRRA